MERAMRAVTSGGGPALVVLRPPLVYGVGVRANFLALLRLVDRGLPLPFASIRNRRGFVYLDNLLDLIDIALAHPAAAGGTFLLRDDEELSTPQLIRRIARHLHRPARLFSCPLPLLRIAAASVGRRQAAGRLLESLSIDDQATRQMLGWRPKRSVDEGLAETSRWFRASAGRPI
jgi:nucleoside-diphosphate-sugar epimerase